MDEPQLSQRGHSYTVGRNPRSDDASARLSRGKVAMSHSNDAGLVGLKTPPPCYKPKHIRLGGGSGMFGA
jgi:hypothetical protein